MKETPLRATHEALDAMMVDFDDWYLPGQYTSITDEHNLVRNNVGVFDLCYMGELWLTGHDALANIQNLVTQDIEMLSDRQIAYTPMCRPDGTIVDLILVFRWDPKTFMLLVNGKNIEKDINWIRDNINGDVNLSDQSEHTGMLSIQGPNAEAALQKLTRQKLDSIQYYWFTTGNINGIECVMSRTSFTGEDGFDVFCDGKDIEKIWNALLEAGKEVDVKPIGMYALDSLRLEGRLVTYGLDVDDNTNPIEANLNWTVNLNKKGFIGYDVLKHKKENGVGRTLIGFEMPKGPVPRHGNPVVFEGKRVGIVTSACISPTLKKNIGLAMVPISFKELGAKFDIEIRGKYFSATVIETPFYKR